MNLQALAAMDDCEHATGKTLEQHISERRTPVEVLKAMFCDRGFARSDDDLEFLASEALREIRAAGYAIVQIVQTGNKPFP